LAPGDLIIARVSAQNEHGPGPYSVTVNSDQKVIGTPGEIKNLKIETTESKVTLKWAESISATAYRITYTTEENGEETVTKKDPEVHIDGRVTEIRIRAINECAEDGKEKLLRARDLSTIPDTMPSSEPIPGDHAIPE